tara:strand:+ start:2947 stop:3612 length:666 start_codon:yes stop_codon:yes gene_type:complete
MKLLLVSATYSEIRILLENAKKITSFNDQLSTYSIFDKEFDLLCTGIGMVATSFHMGKTLAAHSYDAIVNVGIAGSFNKKTPLGTVVEVVQDQFPEMGADDGDNFLSLLELGFSESDNFPFQSGVLLNYQEFWNLSYPKVKSITVNTVHGSKERIAKTQTRFRAQTESMEGAAFFYACQSYEIPCLQIRAISNYVEPRNRAAWNVPLAIKNLNIEILNIIK